MYHIDLAKGPVFGGEYIPYFYQSGKFLIYNMPSKTGLRERVSQSYGRYDFTSDLFQKRVYPAVQTIEDVIQRGHFPIPRSEPETAILSDKKQTSRLGLSDIIQQVRQRYEIYDRNIYQIELGKCYTLSAMFGLEAERGGVRFSSREVYSLNKKLQEFYEQERDERVRLWQDVSRLKLALPEQAQQYLTAHRKVSILEGDEGDGP